MSILPARRDIFDAVQHEDYRGVKKFVQNSKVPPNTTNSIGQTAGHIAAKNGNLQIAKLLLQEDPSIVDIKDHWNQTMLHLATQKGAIEVIRCLVEEYGADAFEPNHRLQGITVLHIAAAKGHVSVLRYFIEERKMDANARNILGQSPAFNAAINNRIFVLKFLAEQTNANLTLVDNLGDNILHMSAKRGDLVVPKYLLDEKKIEFDLNWRNNMGDTIVNRAVLLNHCQFVKYFVEEKHVDVNIADNEGNTPLHKAASQGDFVLVRYFVLHAANLEAKNKEGKTPTQTTTDVKIIEYVEQTLRNQTARSRRNAQSAQTYVTTLWSEPISVIQKRTGLSGEKRGLENDTVDFVSKDVRFDDLLVFVNICFAYIGRWRYRRTKNLSLLSPQEILQLKMDYFAINSINTSLGNKK